jgi:hypothetical protein
VVCGAGTGHYVVCGAGTGHYGVCGLKVDITQFVVLQTDT